MPMDYSIKTKKEDGGNLRILLERTKDCSNEKNLESEYVDNTETNKKGRFEMNDNEIQERINSVRKVILVSIITRFSKY